MEKLLEIKEIKVSYGLKTVLEGIDFNIDYKEIVSIVGESGSGKTTLARSIINLLPDGARATSQTCFFDHRDLNKLSKEEWRNMRGSEIAYIFQNPSSYLNPIIRIGKQFLESIRSHRNISKAEAIQKVKSVLKKMHFKDIDQIMNAYPYQLSGGMKQRVAIAMALVMEPKLIIADEPTSALDAMTQNQIASEIMAYRDDFETSFIIVTHNLGYAATLSDRIMVMRAGKVIEFDTKSKIILAPQKAYTRVLLDAIPVLKGHGI
ncbi:ABC transporter ATP-binding protein [Fusibacter sp. 3D3]|uniref:ABC transporter ATP-binding protein n=1 Tax=Fusibacter sp. 3D3 TaxID=1048380 RepID=UPI000853A679|nr:ABC transporter ATP-binding protein [Fusibacter sp. 3D3]GAU76575.1 oligopeptide transport ATP-binding protein OppD [Fusibacter sp. 3D3]